MSIKTHEKLYCLKVLDYNKEMDTTIWKNLSYSHDRDKLMRSIFLRDCFWNIGPGFTDSEKTVAYTENEVYPQYFIEEVNYII